MEKERAFLDCSIEWLEDNLGLRDELFDIYRILKSLKQLIQVRMT